MACQRLEIHTQVMKFPQRTERTIKRLIKSKSMEKGWTLHYIYSFILFKKKRQYGRWSSTTYILYVFVLLIRMRDKKLRSKICLCTRGAPAHNPIHCFWIHKQLSNQHVAFITTFTIFLISFIFCRSYLKIQWIVINWDSNQVSPFIKWI